MSHHPDTDFTVMIFRGSSNPRIFKFAQKTLERLFWSVPLLLFIITTLGFVGSIRLAKESPDLFIPTPFEEDQKEEIESLQNKLAQSESKNELLRNKIEDLNQKIDELNIATTTVEKAPAPVVAVAPKPTPLPKPTPIPKPKPVAKVKANLFSMEPEHFPTQEVSGLRVSGFRRKVSSSNVNQLNFSLENLTRTENLPIRGIVVVMAKQSNNSLTYPKNALASDGKSINFKKGESFSFSNLRPVTAKFRNFEDPFSMIEFKVYVYESDGSPLIYANWTSDSAKKPVKQPTPETN